MEIREAIESAEERTLGQTASRSSDSRGRAVSEPPCSIRTIYQVDRDRILHCKAFRRLKYKTQVFLAPEGDHYRTRLSHTLEVSQIARTLARALRLNEDLTEAVALGHDLGHTPFGHAGERVLSELLPDGFHHVHQSLRVVERLEKDGRGLNLSWEVRDGIHKHSKGRGALLGRGERDLPATLEGRLVRLADVIAYVNHDLDDALRAGLIRVADLPTDLLQLLGTSHSQRIDTMVRDLIETSLATDSREIALSAKISAAITALREWLFNHVYQAGQVEADFVKASRILGELFHYFKADPTALERYGFRVDDGDDPLIVIGDFLAGMTDRYALNLYQQLFLPQPWKTA